ncbi:adenylyl-sulfate kinase [Candidatus Erwinia haradaeae]|uniref:Adenylyl-sulfate kinase n=1 Tax=Candidatus Erwinia haradaeae TaxID=1922217 RepID=A0A451DIM0_9GAMM|nr:adenylyl-sulfate kinase [Candidatus Erwinia haradaeae]VFP86489.1 Adenylyl-sulfate kinase [Candidatus Erwinia haradaeae]
MIQDQKNIIWHNHPITCQSRETLHGHKGIVLWFTGLSGSGKSTIAGSVEEKLYQLGASSYVLDGDNLRHGLCRDLGFDKPDRYENIRRVGEVAKLMVDAGLIVLTALISPYRSERQMVREMLTKEKFVEIFIDTPFAICEARDPKGLYQKARSGTIPHFTGINSEYQIPIQPEIRLNGEHKVSHLSDKVLEFLRSRNVLSI